MSFEIRPVVIVSLVGLGVFDRSVLVSIYEVQYLRNYPLPHRAPVERIGGVRDERALGLDVVTMSFGP